MNTLPKDEITEPPEVRKAMNELDKSISGVAEIVVEFEARLNSVLRGVESLPEGIDGELKKAHVRSYSTPLAQEIENNAYSISALGEIISRMLLRLEI